MAVAGGAALAVGVVIGAVWWFTTGGVRAGEGQLDAFGVPLHGAVYAGETNDTGSDLCYSAGCTTVTRTYRLPAQPRLSAVQRDLSRRMHALGYIVDRVWYSVVDYEYQPSAQWQFSCSQDGESASKHVEAVIHLVGVDPSYDPRLGPPPHSPYGGLESTDVPRPPGDPAVGSVELRASG